MLIGSETRGLAKIVSTSIGDGRDVALSPTDGSDGGLKYHDFRRQRRHIGSLLPQKLNSWTTARCRQLGVVSNNG